MAEIFFKNWHHFKQIARYVISGGSAATVNLAMLYFFTDYLAIWYLFSAALAYVTAFFVSFFLQKFWTFRDDRKDQINKQLVIYAGIAGFGLVFNILAMYFLVDILRLWYMLAQIIAGFILACCNFLFYKFFVFNRPIKNGADNRTKVLVATGIYPPDIGGPARILEALARDFNREGFLTKIVTYSDLSTDGSGDVYRVKRGENKIFNRGKYFFCLLRLSLWADLIYVTDTYSVGFSAYLIKKLTGKKYLLRFAGDSAWETATAEGLTDDYIVDFTEKKYADVRLEKLKERRKKIMMSADKIIAVSIFLGDLAEKIGVKKDKITVIYNSVDFEKSYLNLKKVEEIKKEFSQETKIILTGGRLMPWKGEVALIELVDLIEQKVGPIKLLILGDGPELSKLKIKSEELKLTDKVKFLGRIKLEETMNYFQAADLFVLNSHYEGFSHMLLEAMEATVPVLTTRSGGNPELIEHQVSGWLIDYNNKDQLVAGAIKILSDPEFARQLTINAKKKLENFKWNNIVSQTATLIREIYQK